MARDIRGGGGRGSGRAHLSYARHRAREERLRLIREYEAHPEPKQHRRSGGSLLRGLQGGLETLGLGGAAHPVRRLHHPGGAMSFPAGGRARTFGREAGIVAGTGAYFGASWKMLDWANPEELRQAAEDRRQSRAHPGFISKYFGYSPPPPPKYDEGKADRLYWATPVGAYRRDVFRLHTSGQITEPQLEGALRWALDASDGELRARRRSLRESYKLPPLKR